jgi:hypothetical protein
MKETTRDTVRYILIGLFLAALALIIALAELYARLRWLSSR